MSALLDLAAFGLAPLHDIGSLILRVAVGVFFAISGWHKAFNAERHAKLCRTLKADGVPCVGFTAWWVAGWELVAGVMLATGLLTVFSAAVLIVICFVACWAEARAKVAAYKPIDAADVLDDYLYLPEVLYLVMLVVIVCTGPGAYSLDALLR